MGSCCASGTKVHYYVQARDTQIEVKNITSYDALRQKILEQVPALRSVQWHLKCGQQTISDNQALDRVLKQNNGKPRLTVQEIEVVAPPRREPTPPPPTPPPPPEPEKPRLDRRFRQLADSVCLVYYKNSLEGIGVLLTQNKVLVPHTIVNHLNDGHLRKLTGKVGQKGKGADFGDQILPLGNYAAILTLNTPMGKPGKVKLAQQYQETNGVVLLTVSDDDFFLIENLRTSTYDENHVRLVSDQSAPGILATSDGQFDAMVIRIERTGVAITYAGIYNILYQSYNDLPPEQQRIALEILTEHGMQIPPPPKQEPKHWKEHGTYAVYYYQKDDELVLYNDKHHSVNLVGINLKYNLSYSIVDTIYGLVIFANREVFLFKSGKFKKLGQPKVGHLNGCGVWFNNQLYLISGGTPKVSIFDFLEREWLKGPELPFAIDNAGVCVTDKYIMLFGGFVNNAASSLINICDGHAWSTLSLELPIPVFNAGAIALDNDTIIVFGGQTSKKRKTEFNDKAWRITVSRNSIEEEQSVPTLGIFNRNPPCKLNDGWFVFSEEGKLLQYDENYHQFFNVTIGNNPANEEKDPFNFIQAIVNIIF